MTDAAEQAYDQGIVGPNTERVRALLETERPDPLKFTPEAMMVRLADLERGWATRLTNQANVIANLSAAREELLAFVAYVRNDVVQEMRLWSEELKARGDTDAAVVIYQYATELRGRADVVGG